MADLAIIEKAVGGSYEFPDGRKFWIDGPVAREISRRVVAAQMGADSDLVAALAGAPILSMYHGHAGFETERFIEDYERWRAQARAALAKAEGR